MIFPQISCNGKELALLILQVYHSLWSSSTSSFGGPVMGRRNRAMVDEQVGDATNVPWRHLTMEGAFTWLPEHGGLFIFWLRRHLHPQMASSRRRQPLPNLRESWRGGPQEDAWTAHLAVVAAQECGSDTWWSSVVGFPHVYFRDPSVILYSSWSRM